MSMNATTSVENQLFGDVKVALQKQLETINRLISEDVEAHQLQLATSHCEGQLSEDLQLLVGPSASLRLTLEAGSEASEGVHVWTAFLQLSGGCQNDSSYGALAQLLARYLLLCLKKQGQLDKVSEPGSVETVILEPEDTIINNWDGEDDDDDSEEDELPPIVAVNMNTLSRFGPSYLMVEKETFLAPQRLHAIRTLTHLHCGEDPVWTLQLLERAAPRLHELHLVTPSWAHLQVLGTMQQLNKLEVQYYGEDWGRAMLFSPAPAAHRGLEWLRLSHLPRETTLSLLRAHGRTLRELWLGVGSWEDAVEDRACPEDERWPVACRDLADVLARCRLKALWRLVLFRWLWSHGRAACSAQRAAVRDVLPGVTVLCYDCDRVQDVSLTGEADRRAHARAHAHAWRPRY